MKENEKLKIGQIITITEDFEIKSEFTDTRIMVKKGDKGFVDSSGSVHYLSGEAKGKIQNVVDSEGVEGYAVEDITFLIYQHLKNYFNLSEVLEDYDIEEEDFKSEIEYILEEIL